MKTIHVLPNELQDNQYYMLLMDTLILEKDHSLINRLQKADAHTRFIKEQASILVYETNCYLQRKDASFVIASDVIIEQWKQGIFH